MDQILNDAILNKAAQYRGWILNGTISLERVIDVYLTKYFVSDPEKQEELLELVFAASNGMPFEPKKALFVRLLKKHHKEFSENNQEFFKNLTHIIEQRNILAHYLLDRSDEGLDMFINKNQVGFVKFKEVTETIPITEKNISETVDKIEACIQIVMSISESPQA